MFNTLEISADLFTELASEHVGAVDLSDRMLMDKSASVFAMVAQPTTTVLHTRVLCH